MNRQERFKSWLLDLVGGVPHLPSPHERDERPPAPPPTS
jgi:hypothetical protein